MVQIPLRRLLIVTGFLLVLLVGGAFLVSMDCEDHSHVTGVVCQVNPLDEADLLHWSPHRLTVTLDPVRTAEVGRIYAEIVQAYSNRQVNVLSEWRRNLPGKVERISPGDMRRIEFRFSRILCDEVICKLKRKEDPQSILAEYQSVVNFSQSVGAMLAFAGIYGDVRLRRREFGGWFDELEALVVCRLTSYRDCFHKAGRTELAQAAEHFLAEWIDQIESPNGYTKALLLQRIAYVRKWGDRLMEHCGQTWEEISQNSVRQTTHTLICAGYTPMWLDEFKVIPRHVK